MRCHEKEGLLQAPDAYGETEHGHSHQWLLAAKAEQDCQRPGIHYERRANLPEQGAPFAGPAPTTGFHAICWDPVNTAIGHKSQAPDLEPIAQTDQLTPFPFGGVLISDTEKMIPRPLVDKHVTSAFRSGTSTCDLRRQMALEACSDVQGIHVPSLTWLPFNFNSSSSRP